MGRSGSQASSRKNAPARSKTGTGASRRKKAPAKNAADDVDLGDATAAWKLGNPSPMYAGYRLLLVAKMIDRCVTRQLHQSAGISLAEWRVLRQLYMADAPASLRELAETAWVDRAEVSRAVTSLVRRRYIQRRTNPEDRRSSLLTCTRQGRAMVDRLLPERTEFHAALTGVLSKKQQEELVDTLRLLAQQCTKMLETTEPPSRGRRKRN